MLDSITIVTMVIVVHLHHDIAYIPSVVLCRVRTTQTHLIPTSFPGAWLHAAHGWGTRQMTALVLSISMRTCAPVLPLQ